MKLWPLFRYARDDANDVVRWSAFGPIMEFTRTPETRDLRIRPVLWLRQKRGLERDDQADILFPLISTRWLEDYHTFRFLLFTYSNRPAPKAESRTPAWTSRFELFPFVFYRSSPALGTYFGVLPFYLDMPDFYGFDRFRAVMLPAYLRLTEPRVERRFFPFPFVSTVGGPDGRGFRLWPIYGRTERVGTERTSYILWPFHIRRERLVPGYGWEKTRIDLPFVSAIDGARRRSRFYGVFAHTHTVDQQRVPVRLPRARARRDRISDLALCAVLRALGPATVLVALLRVAGLPRPPPGRGRFPLRARRRAPGPLAAAAPVERDLRPP